MPTPKNAPYKLHQRGQRKSWTARFWDMAKIKLSNVGGARKVKTRSGRTYVIDPITGQWWRPEKWAARQAARR